MNYIEHLPPASPSYLAPNKVAGAFNGGICHFSTNVDVVGQLTNRRNPAESIIRVDNETFSIVSHNPSGSHGGRDNWETAAASLISHLWPPLLQRWKCKNVGGSVECPDIRNIIANNDIVPAEKGGTFCFNSRLQLSRQNEPSLDTALRPIVKQQVSTFPHKFHLRKQQLFPRSGKEAFQIPKSVQDPIHSWLSATC